jgi:hypothetical protein
VTDETDKPDTPPTLVRIGRLDSLRKVRRELARLYRDLRNERVTAKTAGTGAYILTAITKTLEVEILETRIEALEERAGIADRSKPRRVIGHA